MNIIKPDWPAPSHVCAATTLRTGGVSSGVFDAWNMALHVGDQQHNVLTNRARLFQRLNLPAEPVWLNQVHQNTAVEASSAGGGIIDADASFTNQSEIVCVVMTADCLPILLTDLRGQHIAAIHAGWRSLVRGIVESTLSKMKVKNSPVIAWLGPAISQNFFVVGGEVRALFLEKNIKNKQAFKSVDHHSKKWQADLTVLARLTLYKNGINAVYGGQWCTYTDYGRFYSYRRNGETGRMATLIWKNTRT